MVDIGLVGLDTSHSEGFATSIEEHSTANLTAVWDGGDVRSASYTETFCERHGATFYDTPMEMTPAVDAVMVLTVNWNEHRGLAVPFLARDVPTLIDKPIAGSLEDLHAIRSEIGETPFFGGSAVPYHSDVRSLETIEDQQTVYCVGYNDPFYYGSHVVDTLRRLVDEPWACVSRAADPGQTVDVAFTDGTHATVRLDDPSGQEQFTFFSVGDRTTVRDVGNSSSEIAAMYRNYVDAFIDVVNGQQDPSDRVLDAASLLLAVNAALEYDGPITPDCRLLEEYAADGDAFLKSYRPYY